ncbi:hypothetical protein QUA62_15150 [Microcoleus sp. MON1_C1]|uniref:hypothetical protein n=1 Tax=Microcoleus sp. MON1_C1 TaxID=2818827 RepID=UPI002FD2F0B7
MKLKPLTGGLKTVPVLLPQLEGQPEAIADLRQILHCRSSLAFFPRHCGSQTRGKQVELWMLVEDFLDESIRMATRFVY